MLASTDINAVLLALSDRRQLSTSYFKLKVSKLVADGQAEIDCRQRRRQRRSLTPLADKRFAFAIACKETTMAEDTAIEVVLKRSGLTFIVPPDKSILQVLIEEGIDPLYDCQRGECGICQVTVLEGEPDHRDHILSDEERAGNKVMQICVSRAKTPRLVIDL
jgi:ferredoxin